MSIFRITDNVSDKLTALGQKHIQSKEYNDLAEKQFVSEYRDIKQVYSEIEMLFRELKNNQRHILLLRNWPTPEDVPKTPRGVKANTKNDLTVPLALGLSGGLGTVSAKGLENTVRFMQDGFMNEETWHGHPQYKYSIFYCLQGDNNAHTYVADVEETVKGLSEESVHALKTEPIFESEPKTILLDESNGMHLNPKLYAPSDLGRKRPDLDLPNVYSGLERLRNDVPDPAANAIHDFLNALDNVDQQFCYKSGDVAIYNEKATLRYSPGYIESCGGDRSRWLRAVSAV